MKTPIKNFDPYRPPRRLLPSNSLQNLARRIKTRASDAVGLVGRFFSTAMKALVVAGLFWPLWLAIDCAMLGAACEAYRAGYCQERVSMPRKDATTHASDAGTDQ